MKRQIKLVAVTALTASMTTLSVSPAQACDGRGGRRSFSSRISYAPAPVYRHSYRQPVYQAPPVPVYAQPQPVMTAPLASQPVAMDRPAVAPQSFQNQPVQNPLAQTQQQTTLPTSAPAQPATRKPAGSEATALQMLESIGDNTPSTSTANSTPQIPEFTATTSAAAGDHVGTWKVTLPGQQSVELNLNDDGTFRWTASKNGKTSAFEGQYRLESGRLTLVRSSDLQQMAGSWTANGDSFTFKLDGTNTGGLAFARS